MRRRRGGRRSRTTTLAQTASTTGESPPVAAARSRSCLRHICHRRRHRRLRCTNHRRRRCTNRRRRCTYRCRRRCTSHRRRCTNSRRRRCTSHRRRRCTSHRRRRRRLPAHLMTTRTMTKQCLRCCSNAHRKQTNGPHADQSATWAAAARPLRATAERAHGVAAAACGGAGGAPPPRAHVICPRRPSASWQPWRTAGWPAAAADSTVRLWEPSAESAVGGKRRYTPTDRKSDNSPPLP